MNSLSSQAATLRSDEQESEGLYTDARMQCGAAHNAAVEAYTSEKQACLVSHEDLDEAVFVAVKCRRSST